MKFDLKNILILILIIISSFSVWKWMTKVDDSKSQERIKQLEDEFRKLEIRKDSVDNNIKTLELEFEKLELKDSLLREENKKLSQEAKQAEIEAKVWKTKLQTSQKQQEETKSKIKQLGKNPIKREGNDLLESLKNKTK